MAAVKLNAAPGEEYIFRERAEGTGAIQDVFSAVHRAMADFRKAEPEARTADLPFAGELYMGHLRYSTTGRSGISYLHPFLRRNNWRSRNLSLAGNFNLTNVDEVFQYIVARGQHPGTMPTRLSFWNNWGICWITRWNGCASVLRRKDWGDRL